MSIRIRYTQTVEVLTANIVIFRGVETVDWENPSVETIPAHVDYRTASLTAADRDIVFGRELRVLMPPTPLDPERNRIRWEGNEYLVSPPEVRYRYGKPVFQSVTIQNNTR